MEIVIHQAHDMVDLPRTPVFPAFNATHACGSHRLTATVALVLDSSRPGQKKADSRAVHSLNPGRLGRDTGD
jgi:hypothetical protein